MLRLAAVGALAMTGSKQSLATGISGGSNGHDPRYSGRRTLAGRSKTPLTASIHLELTLPVESRSGAAAVDPVCLLPPLWPSHKPVASDGLY